MCAVLHVCVLCGVRLKWPCAVDKSMDIVCVCVCVRACVRVCVHVWMCTCADVCTCGCGWRYAGVDVSRVEICRCGCEPCGDVQVWM